MTTSPSSGNSPHQLQSIFLLRWIGYGLLLLMLLDLVVILVPLNLTDPEWEFQAMGAIVERIPVPLIGLGLVFSGGRQFRKRLEMSVLKLLSWLCILSSIICFAIIPLILVTSAQRLAVQVDTTFRDQLSAQIEQTIVVEEQLSQATNDEILRFLESQGESLNGQTPSQFKDGLIENLSSARQDASNRIQGELQQRHLVLKKNVGKWALGSEISAFIFFYAWRLTNWARTAFKGL